MDFGGIVTRISGYGRRVRRLLLMIAALGAGFATGCVPTAENETAAVIAEEITPTSGETTTIPEVAPTNTVSASAVPVVMTIKPTDPATSAPTPSPTTTEVQEAQLILVGQVGLDVFWSADSRSVMYPDTRDRTYSTWIRRDLVTGETVGIEPIAMLPQTVWNAIPGLPPYSETNALSVLESISPSGAKVFAMRDVSGKEEGELIEIDLATGWYSTLAGGPGACAYARGLVPADWSQDESKAVIGCGVAGGVSIGFVALDIGSLLLPTYFISEDSLQFQVLSPDGLRYAYTNQDYFITILEVSTSIGERVVHPVKVSTPFDWITNDRLLLVQNETTEYMGCSPLGFSITDTEQDETRLMFEFPLVDEQGALVDVLCRRPFKVSPDGTSVLFLSSEGIYVLRGLPNE